MKHKGGRGEDEVMEMKRRLVLCIICCILHVCLTYAALPLQYVQVAIKIVVDRIASTVVSAVLRRKGLGNQRGSLLIGFSHQFVP